MSGPVKDPATMTPDEKLDFLMEGVIRLMGPVTTMNGRLNAHYRWLTRLETNLSLPPLQPALSTINFSSTKLQLASPSPVKVETPAPHPQEEITMAVVLPLLIPTTIIAATSKTFVPDQIRSISDFSVNKETVACKGSNVAWIHVSVQPNKETAHEIAGENQGRRGLHACIHAGTTFCACNFFVEKKKGTDLLFPCTRKCIRRCPHSPGVKSLSMLMDEQIKETIKKGNHYMYILFA
jgi:hypothetical protein